jgi:hypothetical protein
MWMSALWWETTRTRLWSAFFFFGLFCKSSLGSIMLKTIRNAVIHLWAQRRNRNRYRKHLHFESLESRRVLASVISEVHVEPLLGNHDTDQYIELRGTPNTSLPSGSYFVTLEGSGAAPGGMGYIHSAIDVSGLTFGSNGFLVIAQLGNSYSIDASATLVASTATGFSGLPNNRWSDASTSSDRLAPDFVSGTFLLFETAVAPAPGSDADTDDDGILDGVATNWSVVDAVGLLNTTSTPSRSYGKITFSEEPNYLAPSGSRLIDTDGGGYVGRLGDSSFWSDKDWISGTAVNAQTPNALEYRFTFGALGDPRPIVYSGRLLNHLGTHNFSGGALGKVLLDADSSGQATPADQPLANIAVFADANQNGVRDDVHVSVLAKDYNAATEHTNRFPNATLNIADSNNKNLSSVVRTNLSGTRSVFANEGNPWFDASNRLKVEFYTEANFVSTHAIAAELLKDSYARMEVYDKNNNLLEFVQSDAMRQPEQKNIEIRRVAADIKYAIIYTNNNFLNSSSFGSFDELAYSYPEFATTTDNAGKYAIEELPSGDYQIRANGGPDGKILVAGTASSIPLVVTKSEHVANADFLFRNNLPPVVNTTQVSVAENPTLGAVVGQIDANDPDPGQSLSFLLLNNAGPFGVDSTTGEIKVINEIPWDFEKNSSIVMQIRVTDNFEVAASTTRDITIVPTDVNEPPSAVELTVLNAIVDEAIEPTFGVVIADIKVIDDALGNNTLVLSGPDAGVFVIVGNQLRITQRLLFDFEIIPSYSVKVQAVDSTLVGSIFPEATGQLLVRNLPEVVSITDENNLPLGSEVRSVRLHWDSNVKVLPGAIRVQKRDIGDDNVETTFTTSLVDGKTVAELQFSGPWTNQTGLLDGRYVVLVDGLKVEEATTLLPSVNYLSKSILVKRPTPAGKLELIGREWAYAGKSTNVQFQLKGLSPLPTGDIEYQIDWDNDGIIDRTDLGPATFFNSNLVFDTAGPNTVVVTAVQNNVVLAKASFAIQVSPTAKAEEYWLSSLDADRDNTVSPLDVLVVINRINSRVGSAPVAYSLALDVDRDGAISPLDVLALINYLNADPESRVNVFSSLTLYTTNILPMVNDNSIGGRIAGSSRSLFLSLDGWEKKDISHLVRPDGTFIVLDSVIAELFCDVPDGNHTISVATQIDGQYSITMDKRFYRLTQQLNEFQLLSAVPVSTGTRFQWSSSANGARYSFYASKDRGPVIKYFSQLSDTEVKIGFSVGTYDVYIEATDAAGNTKRTPTRTIKL